MTTIDRFLLRSPLHGLVSDQLMLLTVHGRTTGRSYTFPVRFTMQGRTITVLADHADGKTWWLNVVRPAPVVVRIGGRDRNAIAQVAWEADEIDRALAARGRNGAAPTARWAPGGGVAVATRAPVRRDTVVVRITLTADLG
jgi:hypothetical protein